jgi:tripartite-type tricarboxylate transporter receptor subunit TctC
MHRAKIGMSALVCLVAAALWHVTFDAQAQAYPSRPIKVVVPYPPGGYYDVMARVVGHSLAESMGQPVIVENKPGANGIVGTEFTAKSAPDGYTIMTGGVGPHGINPTLYTNLPDSAERDFAPIILVATQPNILVVHPSVQASSVRELVALAQSKPGRISFASAGAGSSQHLSGEMLSSLAGIRMNHIPFKGGPPATTAVLGGQVDLVFGTAADMLVHIRAGKLRALGVTSTKRISALPSLPTMIESGISNFEATAWFAYYAPAGVSPEIIARLNAEIGKALNVPVVRERLSAQGTAEIVGGTPEDLAAFMQADIAKWAKVIKSSGARAD